MTNEQKISIKALLSELGSPFVHHGDCKGADEDFNLIAMELQLKIIIHPPEDTKFRAYCSGSGFVESAKGYLERNKDIVNSSILLIAAPGGTKELVRSGTWSTVRYARKWGVGVVLVYPNGNLCFMDK